MKKEKSPVRFEKLGIITGIYLAPKEIGARDISIMKNISHHISVALEEARLYKDSVTNKAVKRYYPLD